MASLDMKDVKRFMAELKKIDPETAKETRNKFRSLARVVAQDARNRASQHSRSGKMARSIVARGGSGDAAIASSHPGLPTMEFGLRHPLFGTGSWYQQAKRPVMWPAVEAHSSDFEKQALAAIDAAARKAGFK
jgi:hypothetical protein